MDARFHTLDVFSDRPFGGNQLAVFPDAAAIPEHLFQSIAREFNLSETVFVLPPRRPDAARRLRIFTPGRELPFAGHPTVGSAALLVELGLVPAPEGTAAFVLEEEVGPVPVTVRRQPGVATFAQFTSARVPEIGPPPPDRAALARMLGIAPEDLSPPPEQPQGLSVGSPFLFVPVRDRSVLARLRLNLAEWERTVAGYWATEVFVFCRDPERAGSDLRARMFAPALGITEDPATGSAAAALARYLADRSGSRDGSLRWLLEQGFEMGRPCLLQIGCDLKDGVVQAARVGGHSVRMTEGVLRLP